jgi:tetratricopeptide (TPR) repeat protein
VKILTVIVLLAFGFTVMWWLSGYDPQVTGENKTKDFIRRIIRCIATLFLVWIFFGAGLAISMVPLIMIVPITLGLLWRSPVSELVSRGFHHLTGITASDCEYNPNKSLRDMDTLASLIRNGRHDEAAQLYEMLKSSGNGNGLALGILLDRADIPHESLQKPKPLIEAYRLCVEEKFLEAEKILKSLLDKNPANVDAAMMLMRLYAQNMHRSDMAAEVLRALEKQPHIPAGHIEYARRSIYEWSQGKPKPGAVILPESVDELLSLGYLGTAIGILERKIKEQPEDFDSWLKLAEVHAKNCGNLHRTEKIVEQIEIKSVFRPEQIQLAKAKLKEWREAKPGWR